MSSAGLVVCDFQHTSRSLAVELTDKGRCVQIKYALTRGISMYRLKKAAAIMLRAAESGADSVYEMPTFKELVTRRKIVDNFAVDICQGLSDLGLITLGIDRSFSITEAGKRAASLVRLD